MELEAFNTQTQECVEPLSQQQFPVLTPQQVLLLLTLKQQQQLQDSSRDVMEQVEGMVSSNQRFLDPGTYTF